MQLKKFPTKWFKKFAKWKKMIEGKSSESIFKKTLMIYLIFRFEQLLKNILINSLRLNSNIKSFDESFSNFDFLVS